MTGDSGAKKTPTLNKFLDPLRRWLMEERANADPYFDKPSTLETITTDATPEALAAHMARHNGRAIIFTDEGSAMNVLTGMTYRKPGSEANIDALLQSYDGRLVSVARKLADSSFDIPEAHLALTVACSPACWKSCPPMRSWQAAASRSACCTSSPSPWGTTSSRNYRR